jgi:hypothetical protein
MGIVMVKSQVGNMGVFGGVSRTEQVSVDGHCTLLATLFIIFLTFSRMSVGMEADVLFVLSLRTTLNI